jgi:hypothetical protein
MICQLKLLVFIIFGVTALSASTLLVFIIFGVTALSASTLLVFIIFGVTVALYVHTARVRHIRSDCSLCVHTARAVKHSQWLSFTVCTYRSSSVEYSNRNAPLLASLKTAVCVPRYWSAQGSRFARFRFHIIRDTKSRSTRNSTTALDTHYHYYDEPSRRQTSLVWDCRCLPQMNKPWGSHQLPTLGFLTAKLNKRSMIKQTNNVVYFHSTLRKLYIYIYIYTYIYTHTHIYTHIYIQVIHIYIYILHTQKHTCFYCRPLQVKQRRYMTWESPDVISKCGKRSTHLYYPTQPPICIILLSTLSELASYSPSFVLSSYPRIPSVLSSYP